MNSEELVPSLELCKKIPAGEFEDCGLYWAQIDPGVYSVFLKDCGYCTIFDVSHKDEDSFPAPTVTEILKVLWDDYQKPTVYFRNIWYATVVNDYGDEITAIDDKNSANAALKLWLKLKGIE